MHEIKTLLLYYSKCPARDDFQENCDQYFLIQIINQMVIEQLESMTH